MRRGAILAVLCFLFAATAAFSAELKTHTNSIGMEFVLIPAGSYLLEEYVENEFGEKVHKPKILVSTPFYLGKYQVTQEHWVAVMGGNPARFKGRNNPVENISWDDAQQFIRRLNAREHHERYRLPTEMEWGLAASGGTGTQFFCTQYPRTWEDVANSLDAYAWFQKNSGGATHPVGQKKPNQYGLYDIFGNVWEWVQDWHGALPTEREITDYRGPASGLGRVLRGGSWDYDTRNYQWTNRIRAKPSYRGSYVGFRLALSLEKP